jgi:hypothetical protein
VASGLQGFGSHRAELCMIDEHCLYPMLKSGDRVRFIFDAPQGREFLC